MFKGKIKQYLSVNRRASGFENEFVHVVDKTHCQQQNKPFFIFKPIDRRNDKHHKELGE